MFNPWNALSTLAIQTPEAATDQTDTAASKLVEVTGEATEIANATGSNGLAVALLLLKVAVILILPLVVGVFIAKSLKLKDHAGRIAASLLALSIGVAPLALNYVNGVPFKDTLKLGIDLAGGANLVYEVMPTEGKPINDQVMDKMVGAIIQRINPSGQDEITVRRVGADRIEVIVPGKDPATVDAIKAKIVKLGTLEFYITANRNEDSSIVQRGLALDPGTREVRDSSGTIIAKWLPAFEKNNEPKFLERSDAVRRQVKAQRDTESGIEEYDTEEYLLLVDPEDLRVSGKFLNSAGTAISPEDGSQLVTFRFDQMGAYRFGQLTSRFKPRTGHPDRGLAIVLDGRVFSSPAIRDTIMSNGQITGDFSAAETKQLADVLNAGALEVPLNPKPMSEATLDPTLGEDVRNKGVQAILIAAASVVCFMLLYYRAAGLIAIICLIMNLFLVLSTMMLIEATFTLPGLAGLVLTIGMAVDANVLIFERIREEVRNGRTPISAIDAGYRRALTTIIDANVTTLIAAVLLYAFGSGPIKGFAVTLSIGLMTSMFTAIMVTRLVIVLWLRRTRPQVLPI